MRVALVGWDIDDAVAGSLAGLGAEVVAFTRWFPDQSVTEDRGGWRKERCAHQIGGGPATEARGFRESVLGRAAGMRPFDVVHALDPMSRPAAEALAERSPGCARVACLARADVCPELDRPAALAADRWLAEHPWILDRWGAAHADEPGTVVLVPSRSLVERAPVGPGGPPSRSERAGPLLVIWLPRNAEAEVDAAGVARALAEVAAEVTAFAAIVLGAGPGAHALRTQLVDRRLLDRPPSEVVDHSPAHWSAWLASASVVGLAVEHLSEDPAAWAAWSFGVPVVRLIAGGPRELADALRAALSERGRAARVLKVGAAIAERRLSPSGVAQGWLRVYLDALARPASPADSRAEPSAAGAALVAGGRTRLVLVAIGSREIYAAWQVRPDDRLLALEWLGPRSAYASVVLRFYDVTDILFDGTNAHAVWDVDLAPGERFRTIPIDAPGRSLAASLGLRTPRGHFHPLAHAGPTHLPREAEAANPATRWLRALPRR
jgi:hypothetical protein